MKIWSIVAVFMVIAISLIARTVGVPVSQPRTVRTDTTNFIIFTMIAVT